MRSLKKIAAVALASVMTMAMGISAFAEDITVHFNNPSGWSKVGVWAASMDWSVKYTPKADTTPCDPTSGAPIWPGAVSEAEGNGWYKITLSVDDRSQGLICLFNNFVGDKNGDNIDCGTSGDICDALGIPTTASTTKEQSDNMVITAKMFTGSTATEWWAEWSGNTTGAPVKMTDAAPASYTPVAGSEDTTAAAEETTVAGSEETTATADDASAETTAAASSSNTESSPKTGDTVAMSVVLFGMVAAVAFVASKKKANA